MNLRNNNSNNINDDNLKKDNKTIKVKQKEKNLVLKKKDLLILEELIEDGRKSASIISKKIDLGREIVNYRIKRLIKENLIVKFVPKINDDHYYKEFIVFLKLKLEDPISKKKFIKDKIGNKYILWFVKNNSGWDVIIKIFSHTFEDFKKILNNILKQFNEFLSNYYAIICSEDIKESEKEIIFNKLFNKKYDDYETIKEECCEIELDDKDINIIEMLLEDARTKYTDMAERLEISPDSVKYRITKLINNRVLLGFYPLLNLNKIGLFYYAVILKLEDINLEEEKELFNFLKNSNYVSNAIKSFNSFEYFMNCIFNNEDEKKEFEDYFNNKFKNKIEHLEFFLLDS